MSKEFENRVNEAAMRVYAALEKKTGPSISWKWPDYGKYWLHMREHTKSRE